MIDKTLCPLCGEGHLTSHTEETATEYGGKPGMVILHFVECDACGSEIADDVTSRANKRAVLAFRKSVDGLLTGAEIRTLREKYGITQDQAARLFGGGPKAFSKYEADDVAHSVSMDNLLRLVQRSEEAFAELVSLKGMASEIPPRPTRAKLRPAVIEFVVKLAQSQEDAPYTVRRMIPYTVPHGELHATLH